MILGGTQDSRRKTRHNERGKAMECSKHHIELVSEPGEVGMTNERAYCPTCHAEFMAFLSRED